MSFPGVGESRNARPPTGESLSSRSSRLFGALVANKPLPLKLCLRERHRLQKFGTLEATLGSNGDQRRERGPIKGELIKPGA